MFAVVHLDKISGGDFFEVLQSLVSKCVPNGETILKVLSDYSVLFLILGIAVGISQCFFGYRLRKLWTAILMIILCGCGGAFLAAELGLSVAALVGITAGMAVVGGLLGYFLWIAGCFARPFVVVTVTVFAVFAVYDLQTLGLIVGLAAGLIAGIVAAAFYRMGLMVYSAVFGGLLTGECIWSLVGLEIRYPALIIGGILALAGFGVQFFVNRKPEGKAVTKTEQSAEMGEKQPEAEGAAGLFAAAQEGTGGDGELLQRDGAVANGGGVALQPDDTGTFSYGTVPQPNHLTATDGTIRSPEGAAARPDQALTENSGNAVPAGFCPSCGTPYSARAKYCMQCGRKLQL